MTREQILEQAISKALLLLSECVGIFPFGGEDNSMISAISILDDALNYDTGYLEL